MTCSVCSHQFCWLCKREYSYNHFAPWNIFGCPGLQSNGSSFLGNDECCGINCGLGCGVAGFIKRIFFRLFVVIIVCLGVGLALGVGLPLVIVGSPFYCLCKWHGNRAYRRRGRY